jgi:hypothetical protein
VQNAFDLWRLGVKLPQEILLLTKEDRRNLSEFVTLGARFCSKHAYESDALDLRRWV